MTTYTAQTTLMGNFLEIGFQRQRQGKQQVIYHIQNRRQHNTPPKEVDAAVGQEHNHQSDIFKNQRAAFTKPVHSMAHQRCKQHVGHQIDQEQRRDLMHLKSKFFDHHEPGEYNEYLPPRTSHELQRIV